MATVQVERAEGKMVMVGRHAEVIASRYVIHGSSGKAYRPPNMPVQLGSQVMLHLPLLDDQIPISGHSITPISIRHLSDCGSPFSGWSQCGLTQVRPDFYNTATRG